MLAGGLLPQWIPSVHLDDEEFQQKQEGRKSVASH
jgi:hypothetical protein